MASSSVHDTRGDTITSDNPTQPPQRPPFNRSISYSDAIFSQRIVNMDHYMAVPCSEFDSTLYNNATYSPRVPVLRIFGATPAGQKTCTHVHGVFPYITILYDSDIDNFEDKILDGVEKALNDFLKTALKTGPNSSSKSHFRRHIFKSVKICGRTYYGYRHSEELFLRLYFYNPYVIRKAADLLLSGSVLGKKFQPYNAHIPYHLQFLIDYNLYGMNLIHYGSVKFRRKPGQVHTNISPTSIRSRNSLSSTSGVKTIWNLSQIPGSLYSRSLEKTAVSELEIDVCAADIIISSTRSNARSSNPGIDSIWQDEMERRRLLQGDDYSQVSIPESQSRESCGDDTMYSTETLYKQILIDKLKQFSNQNIPANNVNNNADGIPASQIVHHHLSSSVLIHHHSESDIPINTTDNDNDDQEEDDDELYELFKEFMKEKDNATICDEGASRLRISGQEAEEEDDLELDLDESDDLQQVEAPEDDEHEWSQSFLSSSILQAVLKEESDHYDHQNIMNIPEEKDDAEDNIIAEKESDSNQNDSIFQGDGQGGSDDDDSDKKTDSKSFKTSSRRSIRTRTTPQKYKDSTLQLPKQQQKQQQQQHASDDDNAKTRASSARLSTRKKRLSSQSHHQSPSTSTLRESDPTTPLLDVQHGKKNKKAILTITDDDDHQQTTEDIPVNKTGPKERRKSKRNLLFEESKSSAKAVEDIKKEPTKVAVELLHPSSKEYKKIIQNNPVIRIEKLDISNTTATSTAVPTKSCDNNSNKSQNAKFSLANIIEEEEVSQQHEETFIKNKRNVKRNKKTKQLVQSPPPSTTSFMLLDQPVINELEQQVHPFLESHSVDCETECGDSQIKKVDPVPLIPAEQEEENENLCQPSVDDDSNISNRHHQSSQTDFLSVTEAVNNNTNNTPVEKISQRSISVQTEWKVCIDHSCCNEHCKPSSSTIPNISDNMEEEDNLNENVQDLDNDIGNSTTDTECYYYDKKESMNSASLLLVTPTKLNFKATRKSKSPVVIEGIKKSPDLKTNQYKTLFKKMLRKNQKTSSLNLLNCSPCPPSSSGIVIVASAAAYNRISPIRKNNPYQGEDLSFFQIKRSASRSKSRKRRMKLRAKKLVANYFAPDIFRHEYEPLKFAPSYKRVLKRSRDKQKTDRKKRRLVLKARKRSRNKGVEEIDELSSQENTPQKIRKFNVGSSSEDDDDSSSDSSERLSCPKIRASSSSCLTPRSQQRGFSTITPTPRSILRSSKSAREMRASGKRKIRWDDGSPKHRKMLKCSKSTTKVNNELKAVINNSELDGPSPKNLFGFEHDMSNLHDAKALHQHQYINVMSLEMHCESREDHLLPNPTNDKILGIFIYVYSDYPDNFSKQQKIIKCFLLNETSCRFKTCLDPNECEYFSTELELLNGFLFYFHECDPDILVGYEIERFSWGYLLSRSLILGFDIQSRLSRLHPAESKNGASFVPTPKRDGCEIPGRIVLNLWKLLRHEITVQSYTYENAAYHVLHRRVCRFNHSTLMQFWNHPSERWRVLEYYTDRAQGSVDIINTLDMINRTSELARLFGILFFEVFSRGSQYRVESMMLRVTKSQSLIPVSPSVGQRAKMRAPEFLPLILEPQSNYYTWPVAVLDFQSLYPSMMIAYNYDYATVIGRVEHLGREDPFQLGCIENEISPSLLKKLGDDIHISPAGVAFVKSTIRKGVLSEMLEQILDTRQMVKRSMKKWKNEGATIHKILDSRQLGLKLIANVTYGYTSANFSGRMPCVDIADSVVSKGRETLQRAIDFVKLNFDRWGGEVIYGDTDSLFVLFRGKTKAEAFRLGREIADQVTQLNPKPVKLKFEKIYQPCILQTKKRYVGYSYETEDQVEPLYDAKGIETVRRDGCPAVKKILEKSLHILFTTNDCEKVKNFLQQQFKKLFMGRVSMKDYTFAKAYRGREGYKPGACVPSLEIAKKASLVDPRAEPLTKQRVPYVIIYDKPTLPLIKMVRTPMEFANDDTLRLNAHYYIEKAIIPALNRCLGLAKMDVMKWYKSLPRKYLRNFLEDNKSGQGRSLDDFVLHSNCPRCYKKTEKGICINCDNELQKMTSFLVQVSSDLSTKLDTACRICVICSGDDDKCDNTDCPVFHKLLRYERDEHYNKQLLSKLKTYEI